MIRSLTLIGRLFLGALLLLLLSVCTCHAAVVEGEYVVYFRQSNAESGVEGDNEKFDRVAVQERLLAQARESADMQREAAGPAIFFEYQQGFAVNGLTAEQAEEWRQDSDVERVFANTPLYTAATQSNPPSWGLDRIDQPRFRGDNEYNYQWTGAGVTVFVLDTGIRTTHEDFGGRATCGFEAVDGTGTCSDSFGHGTHVAGTVGGTTYGVAKDAKIVAVKVLDDEGQGSLANIIAAFDYVADEKDANPNTPMVINMSLSGDVTPEFDGQIQRMIDRGIIVVAAAGNNFGQACAYSPGATRAAITVGATSFFDFRSSFSNWGRCVDIFAPGSRIMSTYSGSDTDTSQISGTSMAAPHVAGAAALYLEAHPTWTQSEVKSALERDAIKKVRRWIPLFLFTTRRLLQVQNIA